jgi:molybdate transport system substrate-binding protein
MRRTLARLAPALFVLAALVAACGVDTAPGSSAATGTDSTGTIRGNVTVFAAASLTEPFGAIAAAFQARNPGTKITFSFASSSALAAQINQGAPADVFAPADTTNMDKVTAPGAEGTASAPAAFATNKLQIIVGKGNPKGIGSLADLTKPGVVYVTAADAVPIGAYAKQALTKAGVTVTPKSFEADVKAIVTKVVLGEADAGIVYATDVLAAGDKARGVAIPDAQNVIATYPIAVLDEARNAPGAAAFVAFVTGAEGRTILTSYGFTAP